MGRPIEYHVIDQRYDQQRNEYSTVGVETMYAIRTTDSNLLVNRMWKAGSNCRKYSRMLFVNRAQAQNTADQLNETYHTDRYRVCPVKATDEE